MINKISLLILIAVFSIGIFGYTMAQLVTEPLAELVVIESDFIGLSSDTPTEKEFDLTNIMDGSKVESVSMIVTVSGNATENCYLFLLDSFLDEIPTSDKFSCNGISPITLNQDGEFAVESKLNGYDKISFGVKTDDGEPVNSSISTPEIQYKSPTYFAKVEDGVVTQVIVADINFINGINKVGDLWIETFIDGSKRGNFAGIGLTYDGKNDVFIPQKPFASWILNSTTWNWDAPIPYPNDGNSYYWNESIQSWVLV